MEVADKDEPVMTDDQDANDEKAPEVVVKTVEPPVELTPGFAIAATSPKTFKGLDFGTSAILLEHELKKPENLVRDTPITLEAIKTVLDEVNALYLQKDLSYLGRYCQSKLSQTVLSRFSSLKPPSGKSRLKTESKRRIHSRTSCIQRRRLYFSGCT